MKMNSSSVNLSQGQLYFLNTFGYITLREWRLKGLHPPAANGKVVWQYQKGIKHVNSFGEQINKEHSIEKQNTAWLESIQPPEIEVKRSYITSGVCNGGIIIICPICDHVNHHNPREGHRACDRVGNCPGYGIKLIDA
jgi:hypothetical protein